MKKITFLLSFIACVVFAQAQNLLTNPSFETWTSGKPDSWTLGTTGTVTQSSTTATGSGSALQIAATGTFSTTQVVVGPFNSSKQYKVVIKYKVTAGDGTDARIWSNWITSTVGATTTVYSTMSLADSLGLKGPGGNSQPASGVAGNGTNGYLIDNRTSSDWNVYTFSFTPPANATQFSFQIRTYNTATVIWDDLYFGLADISGTNNPSSDKLHVIVLGKNLLINNIGEGSTIEIYSALGSKVQTSTLENGKVSLNNLAKGMYVVRAGKLTQKFML